MPRPLRIDVPDTTHHIAALAVEKELVFRESADRRRFISQLAATIACYGWNCRAYCLMGNHFHLIVHTPEPNLSRGMQHLCGVYAKWFNWKYARRGHLFGRRFGSAELVTASHLLQAHRYVALNPVRAELCRTPESWRWGSFRALVGLDPPPDFLDVAGVHDLFTASPAKAQSMFRRFVESATRDAKPAPLARVPGA